MESQRNIFDFLSDIYDKYGITGFTENKLKLSDLYEEIVSLNKDKIDLQEFCCKLIIFVLITKQNGPEINKSESGTCKPLLTIIFKNKFLKNEESSRSRSLPFRFLTIFAPFESHDMFWTIGVLFRIKQNI